MALVSQSLSTDNDCENGHFEKVIPFLLKLINLTRSNQLRLT